MANYIVSLQPQGIRNIPSEQEAQQLIEIVDKLLQHGEKLEISYTEKAS